MTENKLQENQQRIERAREWQRKSLVVRDIGLLLTIIALFAWNFFQSEHLRSMDTRVKLLEQRLYGGK